MYQIFEFLKQGIIYRKNNILKNTLNKASDLVSVSVDAAKKITSDVVKTVKEIEIPDITAEDILIQATRIPGVKIDREEFLHKELIKYYSEDIINIAIKNNPAYAGIEREKINKIANKSLNMKQIKFLLYHLLLDCQVD